MRGQQRAQRVGPLSGNGGETGTGTGGGGAGMNRGICLKSPTRCSSLVVRPAPAPLLSQRLPPAGGECHKNCRERLSFRASRRGACVPCGKPPHRGKKLG